MINYVCEAMNNTDKIKNNEPATNDNVEWDAVVHEQNKTEGQKFTNVVCKG
jgi:hypothetical protein